ncbi:hypothetical protein [Nocardioides sp. URHA0020]|uniref:hypothetical protein n=1 Tax=Nocardioides sp. URHA0020 TaxID=1380392 RepID=UPI00048BC062|nr:hypothetical protein [Nocardioides sp. URHA0020]
MTEIPFADQLWPGTTAPASYLPLSRGGVVRSLLPTASPLLLRSALARSNGPEGVGRHLARRLVASAAGTRLRLGRSRPDERDGDPLRQRLSELAGTEVHLAVHFGPPRANRKPVVQALDGAGRLVLVAKLGVDDLSARLVAHEAEALRVLAGRTGPHLLVPELLGLESWGGRPLLVQGALTVPSRHRIPAPVPRHLAEEAIATLEVPEHPPVRAYVDDLCARIDRLPDPAPRAEYVAAARGVGDVVDLDHWPSAPWHGDWSPQNVAACGGSVAAWDWERFAVGRPRGFDTAHFRLQQLLRERGNTQPGVRLLDEAPALLGDWQGRARPARARSVAVLLLLELATRYLGDGQVGTSSPGAGVAAWVAPVLRQTGSLYGSTRGTTR